MIDLHIHTNHSDGILSVREILERAEKQKITTISFCDHNKLGAYEELAEMKEKSKINIITGIEFDFVFQEKNFHMLGYDFDYKKMQKSSLIDKRTKQEIIEKEMKNLKFLKEVCIKYGIKIDEDLEVKDKNEKASTLIKYNMMKFKENDKILDEMLGKNREKSFAREYVQNKNTPFFIDMTKKLPTAKEVADLIHLCKGKVILAHPFDYSGIDCKKCINDIYMLGILDGIEAMHTRHSKEQVEYIECFCKKHNLLVAGGSDFHRDRKQILGHGINGKIEITEEYLLKKKNKIIEIGKDANNGR